MKSSRFHYICVEKILRVTGLRVDFIDHLESISLLFPDSEHARIFAHALKIHVLHMVQSTSEKKYSRCECKDTQFLVTTMKFAPTSEPTPQNRAASFMVYLQSHQAASATDHHAT